MHIIQSWDYTSCGWRLWTRGDYFNCVKVNRAQLSGCGGSVQNPITVVIEKRHKFVLTWIPSTVRTSDSPAENVFISSSVLIECCCCCCLLVTRTLLSSFIFRHNNHIASVFIGSPGEGCHIAACKAATEGAAEIPEGKTIRRTKRCHDLLSKSLSVRVSRAVNCAAKLPPIICTKGLAE